MMRSSLFYSFFLINVEAISFLKKSLQRARVTPALGTSYKSEADACCGCFKRKYSWPENAGLAATFAAEKTCGTCYVADRYGVDSRSEAVFSIPASPSTSTGEQKGADGAVKKDDKCTNVCDKYSCGFTWSDGAGEQEGGTFRGEGACKTLINNALFVKEWKKKKSIDDVCDPNSVFGSYLCPTACGCAGCGGPDQAYEVTQSKVEEIHEWNWNCAEGDAPIDDTQWLNGAVAGEPSVRPPFTMCNEDPGFYCGSESGGPGLKKDAGPVEPKKVDDDSAHPNSVSVKTLPIVKFDFVQISENKIFDLTGSK